MWRVCDKERQNLFAYAAQDASFAPILDDLIDYGLDLRFSLFGGAGAYQPFALRTERLDTPEKQDLFAYGVENMLETGAFRAKIRLGLLRGKHGNAHSFLHEVMHFYQDTHGLFVVPLQEEGLFPVCLDAPGMVRAILFCEAWAQTEAIAVSWRLKERGAPAGWQGALASPEWRSLAAAYEADLRKGTPDEAATGCFRRWYQGRWRGFYEAHALTIYQKDIARFIRDVPGMETTAVAPYLRSLHVPDLLARVPQEGIPGYLTQIDWDDPLYRPRITRRMTTLTARYGKAHAGNIQDIKCGSPPYLWYRLRMAQKSAGVAIP